MLASWSDRLDNEPDHAFDSVTAFSVGRDEFIGSLGMCFTGPIIRQHEFPDARRRSVTYTPRSISRFADCFPSGTCLSSRWTSGCCCRPELSASPSSGRKGGCANLFLGRSNGTGDCRPEFKAVQSSSPRRGHSRHLGAAVVCKRGRRTSWRRSGSRTYRGLRLLRPHLGGLVSWTGADPVRSIEYSGPLSAQSFNNPYTAEIILPEVQTLPAHFAKDCIVAAFAPNFDKLLDFVGMRPATQSDRLLSICSAIPSPISARFHSINNRLKYKQGRTGRLFSILRRSGSARPVGQ